MSKCSDYVFWFNADDPDESCSDSFGARADDDGCDSFETSKPDMPEGDAIW